MTTNTIIAEDLETIYNGGIDWSRFAGKTLLITGANGFLAAYMVEVLLYANNFLNKPVKVLALVRNIERAKSRFVDCVNEKNLAFIQQDVSDEISITENIDFIVHAASQASPKYYGTDPVGTLNANILGTTNLLRLACKNKLESFLFFSSSEVYGLVESDKMPVQEDTYGYLNPLNVRSCYAESKKMGENMCISYMHQYHINAKIVRPFHTYGPGMDLNDGRVFVDFVADILNNKDITMKSDGTAKRAYCYLTDAMIGYFKVLLDGENGHAYNVGNPNNEYSVSELADILVSLFKEKALKVIRANNGNNSYMPSQVSRIVPDVTKLMQLGWEPKVSVEEGFYRTVLSYKK